MFYMDDNLNHMPTMISLCISMMIILSFFIRMKDSPNLTCSVKILVLVSQVLREFYSHKYQGSGIVLQSYGTFPSTSISSTCFIHTFNIDIDCYDQIYHASKQMS